MIGAILEISVKPEGTDAFEKAMKQFRASVDADEPANTYYDVYKLGDAKYIILQRFTNDAALTAHTSTKHHNEFEAAAGKYVAKSSISILQDIAFMD